jgi:hypothetical protein
MPIDGLSIQAFSGSTRPQPPVAERTGRGVTQSANRNLNKLCVRAQFEIRRSKVKLDRLPDSLARLLFRSSR